MSITYKTVSVYIDENDNIIAIPVGESEKYGLMGIDIVFSLSSPYSDEQLEQLLLEAMKKCYFQKADDSSGVSPLEKFLKVKGYAKAVKNKRLISFDWFKDEGYIVIPTEKKPRYGFVNIDDKSIRLGTEFKSGMLANAFREAMKISVA